MNFVYYLFYYMIHYDNSVSILLVLFEASEDRALVTKELLEIITVYFITSQSNCATYDLQRLLDHFFDLSIFK